MVSVGSLAFELGERQEHVEHQPAHRIGRIELLGDRDECDLVLVELGHKLGKVQQAAAESVDLVDHHAVDPAGFDVGHESSKRGALHVATRESTIVVTIR